MRFLTLIVLMLAARAHAQRLDTLSAGSTRLPATYMRNDSSESQVIARDTSAPDGQRVIGHVWTHQRIVQDHGSPALFRVSHFKSARAEVTDSVMTEGTDLIPISEISHQTSKLMHLRWNGRHVTGDVTPTGKATETVDQTMAVAPFNSSDIELLAGSLPLAPGYRALIATYEYESGGLRLDTLAVTGRDNNAWVVRVSRGDSASFTLWIDAHSKRMRQMEIASNPHSWQVRFVRLSRTE